MEILVERKYKKKDYTIGKMYINGEYFCDTLEDTDRGLTQDMTVAEINAVKEYGNTAIPTGRYKLLPYQSPHFGCVLPMIMAVICFSYILMHWGNTNKDTKGCLLLGQNKAVGKVLNSRKAINRLMEILTPLWEQGEDIWITIC